MTWIRWDTATPRSDVVGFLAEKLRLKPVYALGHYNAMCCGFGDHQLEGRLDRLTDTTLEQWADWTGKRGAFAQAIREWCQRAAQDGGDPTELRGWWRQRALLEKQRRDAKKPDGRKKSPANPSGDSDKSPVNPARDSAKSPQNPAKIPRGTYVRTDVTDITTTAVKHPEGLAHISGVVNRVMDSLHHPNPNG